MLLQLHYQFEDHTEMVEQNNVEGEEQYLHWLNDVFNQHDLPIGARWMVCNEQSPHFVMAVRTQKLKKKGGCLWLGKKNSGRRLTNRENIPTAYINQRRRLA